METLLQHLREHREGAFVMDGSEPQMPVRKYVSVFRIDGEPIIPPLMTSEKRRQMQMLREKAIKIEQRLRDNSSVRAHRSARDDLSETSRSTISHSPGSTSQRSQDYYDTSMKESNESIIMLEDLILRHSSGAGDHMAPTQSNACHSVPNNCKLDKMQKLQKSETLIYDNSKNKIIKPSFDEKEGNTSSVCTEVDPAKLQCQNEREFHKPEKPNRLLLAGSAVKDGISIPSICLNPPTPLAPSRGICEARNTTYDNGKLYGAHSHFVPEDASLDSSFCSMLTHSDATPTCDYQKNIGLPRSGRIHDFKTCGSSPSASAQQHETFSSGMSTPGSTPLSSPSKTDSGRTTVQLSAKNMNRSATCHSIKLSPQRGESNKSSQSEAHSPESNLIRSSSFTLEAPSKALIDHMRQQRNSRQIANHSPEHVTTGASTKSAQKSLKKTSPYSRIQRDTVESKAKQVHKVELKPSRPKMQQKAAQHKLAQAAVASMSSSPYQQTSLSAHSSTAQLYRKKKSPYDSPNLSRSAGHLNSKATSQQVRKSPTFPNPAVAVPGSKLNKLNSSANGSQTSPPAATAETQNMTTVEWEKFQTDKLLCLLKQQENEQRKLKETFELQQKLLFHQLRKELTKARISAVCPQQTPAHRSDCSNNDTSGFSGNRRPGAESAENSGTKRSSTFITNNNNLILSDSQTAKMPCDEYEQVPSLPLSLSSVCSIDNSTANTSFDPKSSPAAMSMRSDHTPTSLGMSPMRTIVENGRNSAVGSVSTTSSRRRLFPQANDEPPLSPAIDRISCARESGEFLWTGGQASSSPINRGRQALVNAPPDDMSRSSKDGAMVNAAATVINAYARGFLVRRLFRTEQVQRIVQTIKDTLVFVLNFHLETCANPAEDQTVSNIQLKARLLQQLSSATRTLHLVFFQTSVKERLDIIARDRKRIKAKLLSANRKRYIK